MSHAKFIRLKQKCFFLFRGKKTKKNSNQIFSNEQSQFSTTSTNDKNRIVAKNAKKSHSIAYNFIRFSYTHTRIETLLFNAQHTFIHKINFEWKPIYI